MVDSQFWSRAIKWHTFPVRYYGAHRIRIGLCRPTIANQLSVHTSSLLTPPRLREGSTASSLFDSSDLRPLLSEHWPFSVKCQSLFLDCDMAHNVSQFPVQMYKATKIVERFQDQVRYFSALGNAIPWGHLHRTEDEWVGLGAYGDQWGGWKVGIANVRDPGNPSAIPTTNWAQKCDSPHRAVGGSKLRQQNIKIQHIPVKQRQQD
jgi:hypothetical protein